MEPAADALSLLDVRVVATALAILAMLLLSALFSGAETALTTASRVKLRAMAERGVRGAERAFGLTEDRERLIGAILLGNSFANIMAAALATSLFTMLFGWSGVAVAVVVMTAAVLIFSEVMPKTYAITNAERLAIRVSRIIGALVVVLAPVVAAVRAFARFALRLFGVKIDPRAHVLAAQEEIAGAIALHHSEGAVEKDQRDLLLGALDLDRRDVEEVMMHRRDIEMIDADAAPAEILSLAINSPHTRIPIFRGEPENIVGVIHAKDLSRAVHKFLLNGQDSAGNLDNFDIMDVAMPPYFVPETTPLDEQMREFLRRRAHFALVVDEYGALQGLITLEDIIEEIVGDITDEHDAETSGIEPQPDGSVEADGVVTIRDINRACDWNLPDEEANTVAGLVIHEAQAIPNEGQVFSFHGFRFEVLERENNRLTKMRIRKLT